MLETHKETNKRPTVQHPIADDQKQNLKLDIINYRTLQGVKENPFIELHDVICGFIKL